MTLTNEQPRRLVIVTLHTTAGLYNRLAWATVGPDGKHRVSSKSMDKLAHEDHAARNNLNNTKVTPA